MTNQQSPLDGLNARRERRPLASLDELNRTLAALESRLAQSGSVDDAQPYADPQSPQPLTASIDDGLTFLRQPQSERPPLSQSQHHSPHHTQHHEGLAAIAEELQRLRARTELKQAAIASDKLQTAQKITAAERFSASASPFTAAVSESQTSARTPAQDFNQLLRRDLEDLKRTVETLAREDSLRRMSHRWDALDERFDSFEQRESEKSRSFLSIDPALEAIAHRLDDLRHNMESLPDAHSQSMRQLDERLDEISRAILAGSNVRQSAAAADQIVMAELDQRFNALAHHLDTQYNASLQKQAHDDTRLIETLERRLDHLSQQIAAQLASAAQPAPVAPVALADQQLISNLEKQLGFITDHLSRPDTMRNDLADLKPRLETIERSVELNRDMVLSAAREAAEEAIRQVVDQGSARETGFARQLAADLSTLEQLTRQSDERNSRTFDKVHDTLLKIADRLAQIEQDTTPNNSGKTSALPEHPAMTREHLYAENAVSFSELKTAPQHAPVATPANAALQAAMAAVRNDRSKPADMQHAPDISLAGSSKAPSPLRKKSSLFGAFAKSNTVSSSIGSTADIAVEPENFSLNDSDLLALDDTLQDKTLPPHHAMPDLNAIIRRVRNEQRSTTANEQSTSASSVMNDSNKSDLITAARRAAQAAAEQSTWVRKNPHVEYPHDQSTTDDAQETDPSSFSAMIRRQRKPILMAIGAIIIAVTGMQLGNTIRTNNEEASTVAKAAPEALPQQLNTVPSAAKTSENLPVIPALPAVSPLENHNASHQGNSADSTQEELQNGNSANDPVAEQIALSESAKIHGKPAETAALQPMQQATEKPNTDQLISDAPPAPSHEVTGSIAPTVDIARQTLSPIPDIAIKSGPSALRDAAASGNSLALFEIGNRYTDGRGVESDYTQAARFYQLAAERGLAQAQYRLGNFHEKGLGMPRDTVKAMALYQQAAEQGNASAMHNLAVLYAMGANAAADNDKAARWFFKAAELGVKDSQYNLAILTAKGLGQTQNLEESYKWFSLAAEAGDTDAADKRDQIAKSMQPEQLQRAINLAKLWKPKPLIEAANTLSVPQDWNDNQAISTGSVDMKKAVRNIQLILKKNGYDTGSADGKMGEKTRQAIAAFQKDNGLNATGEVDQPLVEALLSKNS